MRLREPVSARFAATVIGVAIALFGTGAWGVIQSGRFAGGIRFANSNGNSPGTAGTASNPVIWSDATTRPNLRFSDGTADQQVPACTPTTPGDVCSWNGTNWVRGAGSGVTFPIQNGTSSVTFNYGGTQTGSTTDFSSRATNALTTGDKMWSWGDTAEVAFLGVPASTTIPELRGAGANICMRNSSNSGYCVVGANDAYVYGAGATNWHFLANSYLEPTNDVSYDFGTSGTRIRNLFIGTITNTQPAAATGSPTALKTTGGAHTTLTASVEAPDVDFALNRTVQFSTGALSTQRAVVIRAPTYAFVGSSTITTAATLDITGAPAAGTNATITSAYALNLEAGDLNLQGAGARIIAQHFTGRGTAPSIAVGAAAQLGTSPSASVVANSTDTSGTLTITTGTTPSALTANTAVTGATITFANTYGVAPHGILLVPSNSAAAAIHTGSTGIAFFPDQASTSGTQFVVKVVSSGANTLGASTAYQFAYHVIQ